MTATTLNRKATWTNADGLIVGFGTNKPVREGGTNKNAQAHGLIKTASVKFDYTDMNACVGAGGTVNVPVPAGSRIIDVRFVCHTLWAASGTNTFEIGLTGGDTDLFMTTTVGTSGAMTAGAVLLGDGVGTYDNSGDGDVTAAELYAFAAADTIDLVTAMSDWTAGTASIVVTYI